MFYIAFPIIGVILNNLYGINIIYSYINNRNNLINEYNEILFSITFFNALNWSLYGILVKDIFLFICNFASIIGSFGFIQILYKYIKADKLIYIEIISLFFLTYFLIMLYLINFVKNISFMIITNIVGNSVTISSILTNFSPLLIIKHVISTKDTTLIYFPQALIGTINLSCWLVYAILINDIYQIITDTVGLTFCVIQIGVYIRYNYFKF
jgi:solute carrier family 50 protein (sugar transporter)